MTLAGPVMFLTVGGFICARAFLPFLELVEANKACIALNHDVHSAQNSRSQKPTHADGLLLTSACSFHFPDSDICTVAAAELNIAKKKPTNNPGLSQSFW